MDSYTLIAPPDDPAEEKTKPNRLRRGGLFIKDEELMERLGVPEKVFREAIHALDKNPVRSGFPQKLPFWGGRRYWPAVLEYLDYHHGLKLERVPQPEKRRHG